MPLYTYRCPEHGEFKNWAAMQESDRRQPCPACAAPAPRALARPMIGKPAASAQAFACDAPAAGGGGGCACAGYCPH